MKVAQNREKTIVYVTQENVCMIVTDASGLPKSKALLLLTIKMKVCAFLLTTALDVWSASIMAG